MVPLVARASDSASSAAIELLQSHSLTTLVQRELERRILAGELEPGAKLTEEDIAGDLNVSRGPVRESFRALEQAGLVRTEKNRGVFVRVVSLAEADEIYTVRAVLEEAACRMLAARIDAAQLSKLRAHVDAMRDALDAHDHDAYARANVAFHDSIVASAGNNKLYGTYRRLVGELSLFRRAALVAHADAMERSLDEHRAILTALASRDADRAAVLMHAHVNGGRQRAHEACESAAEPVVLFPTSPPPTG